MDPLTLGVIVAGGAAVGITVWRRRRRWTPKPVDLSVLNEVPGGQVDIRELAQIWLRYNDALIESVAEGVVLRDEAEKPSGEPLEPELRGSPSEAQGGAEAEGLSRYRDLLEKQRAWRLTERAIEVLSEHRDVSSFATKLEDPETLELKNYRDVLSKISLMDHTLRVVSEVVQIARGSFQDPEPHLPRLIVAALYHDLGKIPGRMELYGAREHAAASAQMLLEEAERVGEKPVWLEAAVRMVREHHLPGSKDMFVQILRQADQTARAREVAEVMKGFTPKAFEEWFRPDEFMEVLFDYINQEQKAGRWVAFTHQGVIYVKVEGVTQIADEIRLRKKVVSPEFLVEGERKRLAVKIARKLAEKGYTLDPEHPISRFAIIMRDGHRFEVRLLALKEEKYPEEKRREIELRRQASSFGLVVSVKPA